MLFFLSFSLQLEPGVPLPPPEKLKGKILIKDKVRAPKGADQKMATLQRGATLPEVPEDAELTTTTTTSPTKGTYKSYVRVGGIQI